MKRELQKMHNSVSKGKSFHEAAASAPLLFPGYYLPLIKLGENTGQLDKVFLMVHQDIQRDITLRDLTLKSLAYPVFLILFALVVVPLKLVFTEGLERYLSTVLPMVLGVLVIIAVFRLLFSNPSASTPLARMVHEIQIKLPFLGSLISKLAVSRFCFTLGMAIEAGAGIMDGVEMAAASMKNLAMRARFTKISESLRASRGSLTDSAKDVLTHYPIAYEMLVTGEASGRLPEMMHKAGVLMMQETEDMIKDRLKILGLLAFLMVAAYIAYIVISSYAAYYQGLPY